MVAIIYDVTQPSSFESCSSWLSMLRTELDKDGSGQRGGGKAQASNMPGKLYFLIITTHSFFTYSTL